MKGRNGLRRFVLCSIACFAFAISLSTSAQPAITQEPQSQVRAPGKLVSFSVAAVGAEPLQFQWERDGVPIPNARGPRLRFVAAPSRAGTYRAVVRDVSGQESATSPAVLEVKPRPVILSQPRSIFVPEHGTAVFEVRLNNSGPYQHIWWHNDNPLEGPHEIPEGIGLDVHSTRLEIPDCNDSDPYNGLYWIAVTNEIGGTVSHKVRLTVVAPPKILEHPESATVARGRTVVFSFTLVPDKAPRKTMQWFKNGNPIPGARSRMLTVRNVRESSVGFYHCAITSLGGTTSTGAAYLQLAQ